MATWFWFNVPAMVLAFALVVGLPLTTVLRDSHVHARPAALQAAVLPSEDSQRPVRSNELARV